MWLSFDSARPEGFIDSHFAAMKRSIRKTVSSGHREGDGRKVDSPREGFAGKALEVQPQLGENGASSLQSCWKTQPQRDQGEARDGGRGAGRGEKGRKDKRGGRRQR